MRPGALEHLLETLKAFLLKQTIEQLMLIEKTSIDAWGGLTN